MPTIEVYDGDLEGAISAFNKKMENEGTMGKYKDQLAFTTPAEQRRKEEHAAELKRKSRDRRKLLRREAYRHRRRES